MHRFIGYFVLTIAMQLTCVWGRQPTSGGNAEVIQGDFPMDGIVSMHSGYFSNSFSQDLLVTHLAGTIKIATGFPHRTGNYALRRQTLLRFAKGHFETFWQSPPYIEKSSPNACVYGPAWCHGNFDMDPLLEIVELENGGAYVFDFDQGVAARKTLESNEGAIDQAKGWNFDGKGGDEILALKFSWEESVEKRNDAGRPGVRKRKEADCRPLPKHGYRLAVLTLESGKAKEVWSKDFEELPAYSPTGGAVLSGTMAMDGYEGSHPLLRGPQSDVSGSRYWMVSKTKNGNALELIRPFPVEGNVLPIGDMTLLRHDKKGIDVHGTFLKVDKEFNISKTIGEFKNGKWTASTRCEKEFPGTLSEFAIEKNRKGWIHVHAGRFRFYRELPKCEE